MKEKDPDFEFSMTFDQYEILVMMGCYLCGKTLTGSNVNGIDRVFNTSGYYVGNIMSCCNECNMMKKEFDIIQFIFKMTEIYYGRQLTDDEKTEVKERICFHITAKQMILEDLIDNNKLDDIVLEETKENNVDKISALHDLVGVFGDFSAEHVKNNREHVRKTMLENNMTSETPVIRAKEKIAAHNTRERMNIIRNNIKNTPEHVEKIAKKVQDAKNELDIAKDKKILEVVCVRKMLKERLRKSKTQENIAKITQQITDLDNTGEIPEGIKYYQKNKTAEEYKTAKSLDNKLRYAKRNNNVQQIEKISAEIEQFKNSREE